MNKDTFYTELNALEKRFDALEPEVCETLIDQSAGVEGYVVVWNTSISVGGPVERMGKGGTRVTPKTDLDEIKMLARIMALKNAAAGLPLGGAKAGMKADSSAPDFETKYRRFVSLCKPLLFENGGVFGGFGFDIGAKSEMPYWACDELCSLKSFTGKPIEMGGTDYDREGLAGLGVATAAKTMLMHDRKNVKSASFAVQGLGAMGAAVVRYFHSYGGDLRAISDPRIGGTWYLDSDVPLELITALSHGDFDTTASLLQNGDYTNAPSADDVLFVDVDVLFPCAVQDVIRMDNVERIRARYIAEGANNPTSDTVRTWLFDHDVTVVPDFIANAGGIIAAYVELTSTVTPENNIKTRANPEKAKALTIERITDNTNKVMDLAKDLGIQPSHAGRFIALTNIFGREDLSCDG